MRKRHLCQIKARRRVKVMENVDALDRNLLERLGDQIAALAGLAPIARDSGSMRGKRSIGGGRGQVRHVLFQAALVAAQHNPVLRSFAKRLRERGKPHKVIITAVARKLLTIANAIAKRNTPWMNKWAD